MIFLGFPWFLWFFLLSLPDNKPNYGFFGVLVERERAARGADGLSVTMGEHAANMLREEMAPYEAFGIDEAAINAAFEEAGGEWKEGCAEDRRGFEAAVYHETKQILMRRINEFLG